MRTTNNEQRTTQAASESQKKAADTSGSVWVSASAGSGKTTVLTMRVLRLLLEGVKPERILCITYTKSGAAEMKRRIEGRILKWLSMNEGVLEDEINEICGECDDAKKRAAKKLYLELIDDPVGIAVQTTHSFCQQLLGSFPLEAGVSPGFKIIEGREQAELLRQSFEKAYELASGGGDVKLSTALDEIAQNLGESKLYEVVNSVLQKKDKFAEIIGNAGGSDEYEKKIHLRLGVEVNETAKQIWKEAEEYFAAHESDIREILSFLAAHKMENVEPAKAVGNFSEWLNGKGYSFLEKAFLTDSASPRLNVFTKKTEREEPELSAKYFGLAEAAINFRDKHKRLETARATAALARFIEVVLAAYDFKKEQEGFLDYDDLILKSISLLQGREASLWVAYKLDRRIEHLLLDEAQDTSDKQWELAQAICADFFSGESAKNKRSLFVVGDFKQSIFSFQGARPELFLSMQEEFKANADAAEKQFKVIPFERSYRTVTPVLSLVDAAMKEVPDGAGRYKGIRHESGRSEPQYGGFYIWPLVVGDGKEEIEPWPVPLGRKRAENADSRLAKAIADEISGLVGSCWLPSEKRCAGAGDIMIILQRRSNLMKEIIRELRHLEIPVSAIDRLKLSEALEIMDIMSFAKFLLLPDDDYNLACLLKSPFIGISEEDLFELCAKRESKSVWQSLKEKAQAVIPAKAGIQLDSRLRGNDKVFCVAYDFLSKHLDEADYHRPFETFSLLLDKGEGRKKIAARLGEETADSIDEFMNLVLEFEEFHPPTLQGFVGWFGKFETEVKREMEAPKGKVRVMTVHGAKGLEAPIVFMADAAFYPTNREQIAFEGDLFYWAVGGDRAALEAREAKEGRANEVAEEYYRLMYVAMTRAADFLYVCGAKGKNRPAENCWHNIIKSAAERLGVAAAKPAGLPDGWAEEDKMLCYVHIQEGRALGGFATGGGESTAFIGTFPFHNAKKEEERKVIPPSEAGDEEEKATSKGGDGLAAKRGSAVHALLEMLPDIGDREAAAELIKRKFPELDDNQFNECFVEAVAVLDDQQLKYIFEDGLPEQPIAGIVGGKYYYGLADRIVVGEKEVTVVDFKTDREPPRNAGEVSQKYRTQVEVYKSLLRGVFPEKQVVGALLYTSTRALIII